MFSLKWLYVGIGILALSTASALYYGGDIVESMIPSKHLEIEISTQEQLEDTQYYEKEVFSNFTPRGSAKESFSLELKHTAPEEMLKQLKLCFGGEFKAAPGYRHIAGVAKPETIEKLKTFVETMDQPVGTVRLTVEMIQAATDKNESFDLSFLAKYSPGISNEVFASFGYAKDVFTSSLNYKFLDLLADISNSSSNIKCYSTSSQLVKDRTTAEFSYGSQFPIETAQSQNGNLTTTVTFKNIKYSLEFGVRILPSKESVELTVVQKNDSLEAVVRSRGNKAPVISSQDLKAVIDCPFDATVKVLTLDLESSQKNVSAPNIPILKSLLKSTKNTNKDVKLIVFVMPELV